MNPASMIEAVPSGSAEALFAERVRALVAARCGYAPRPAAMPDLVAAWARRRGGR